MVEVKWYMDTYALMEIARGNPKFAKYLKGEWLTSDLTLAEFFGVLLRKEGEKTAEYWHKKMAVGSVGVDRVTLKEAARCRQEMKKSRISFFDAYGYAYSVMNGCDFLTGDKEFEGLRNVEFVKK